MWFESEPQDAESKSAFVKRNSSRYFFSLVLSVEHIPSLRYFVQEHAVQRSERKCVARRPVYLFVDIEVLVLLKTKVVYKDEQGLFLEGHDKASGLLLALE